jgi:hypothetical protein
LKDQQESPLPRVLLLPQGLRLMQSNLNYRRFPRRTQQSMQSALSSHQLLNIFLSM